MADSDLPDWLPHRKVSHFFGISSTTLARWRKDESLNFPTPAVIHGLLYFSRSDLEAWIRKSSAKVKKIA
jgi:predicted DNA-binding transcriptional regulator AlpA